MNHKANAVFTIDLRLHLKRQVTLRELIQWALTILVALAHYTAHLRGGS